MPEEFAFPVSHEVWTPLRVNVLDYARLEGPELRVLGRLARGATLDDAQAELDYMGLRAAADFPDTHEHLRPRVMPYAQSLGILTEGELAALPWINLLVVMLVVLVCGNVGLLMLARAATREGEIVVRNALGASRGRIVTQLVAEALVLGGVGAMVGLAATRPGLRWAMFLLEGNGVSGMPADRSRAEFFARLRRVYQQLERRLSAESGVEGVTFADELPHMVHGARRIDLIEGIITPRDSLRDPRVNIAFVDGDYFDVLGAPLLSGRSFNAADLETGHHVIVVNKTFVDRLLQGRNPIGRRVRFTNSGEEPAPWYEIVGVARDLGMNFLGRTSGNGAAGLYHPLAPGEAQRFGVHMAMKVRGDPASFAPRLRAVAQAVDPTLRLLNLRPLDELDDGLFTALAIFLRVTILTSSVALLLSLAGIYSVTSFAVSRRTREIGIRVALGADARRHACDLLATGHAGRRRHCRRRRPGGRNRTRFHGRTIHAGDRAGHRLRGTHDGGVCMLACIVPARRALAVEPTEALNAEE